MNPRPSNPDAPGPHAFEKRGAVGALLRYVLTPVYYWLDLNGPDHRPQHNKVKTTLVLILATVFDVVLGLHLLANGESDPNFRTELAAVVGLTVFLVFASYGLAGLKIWAETKGGGTVDAVTHAMDVDAKAQADVAARRAQADGSFEVT